MESRNRLIIRCDWETAIRSEGSVWATFKKAGQRSVQGNLKKGLNVALEQGDQCSLSEGFYGKVLDNGQLELQYKSAEDELNVLMQCPSHNFTNIHPAKKDINGMDVSDKDMGVSCDSEGGMFVWDSNDGTVKRELQGHTGEVYQCRFFPSGTVILTTGIDMRLKIWSAEDGRCAATMIGHTRGIRGLSMVERGRNIVSCSLDQTVKMWECASSQCIHTFSLDYPLYCCQVLPFQTSNKLTSTSNSDHEHGTEGKVVLVGGSRLSAFDLGTKHQIFSHSVNSTINALTASAPYCLFGTEDSTLHLLDLRNTREAVKVVKESRGSILSMCVLNDNSAAVSTGDGSVMCVDMKDLRMKKEMTGSDLDPVRQVASDQLYLYTACRDGIIRKYPL